MQETDLVMLRMETDFGYSNTWWRVMFIDNDNTFVGKLERHHWSDYTEYKKGDSVKLNCDNVKYIYKDGEQFCYSDNITICDCKGLCRNK